MYKRPRTIITDEAEFLHNYADCSPVPKISRTSLQDTPSIDPYISEDREQDPENTPIQEHTKDPWEIFEPIAKMFQNRPLLLSRNRRLKHRLFHIEQLVEGTSSLASLLNLSRKINHTSFLKPQELYRHASSVFLVWEPVEISISQILASKCMITAGEILAIVRPVSNRYCRLLGVLT